MGRSVSSPSNAVVVYDHFESEGDEWDQQDDWDWYVDSYLSRIMAKYPSVSKDDGWIGREDRVVASRISARADAGRLALIAKVERTAGEHDPIADLRVGVICPACGHAWAATLDIVAYLWDELHDWAQDLLAEVHVLARHYAWSERDILALTPVRRRFYLDLLQA